MVLKEMLDRVSWKPVKMPVDALNKFIKDGHSIIADQYERNLEELFLLRNPKCRFSKNYQSDFKEFKRLQFAGKPKEQAGAWFYFSWNNQLVHYFPEKLHQELRTGRNKYLITEKEQKKFYNAKIGVLGMSVGSHAALTIALTGGAKHIKLADPDTLSGDNLNRIRTGFQNVGTNKAIAVARQIYEINPYAKVEIYKEGLTEENTARFLKNLDVLVEEMDNPYLKIRIRFMAREKGIPVIMAADNGDGIISDVERFDLNKKYSILHGLLGKITPDDLKNIEPRKLPGVMAKIAGANIASIKMLNSVLEVGKSIYSWPQLGTAATMCGSVLAYLARRVSIRDKKIKSGRYEVNPDAIFEFDYNSKKQIQFRKKERKKFFKTVASS